MVTRGAVAAEGVEGGFSATYRVLSAFEDSGQARRGYVVEGLGAAQFAMDGAVDRLRAAATARDRADGQTRPRSRGAGRRRPRQRLRGGAALAGAADGAGHKPGRKAGSLVVLVDGELTLYMERGGKTLLAWGDGEPTRRIRTRGRRSAARRPRRWRPRPARARSARSPWSGPTGIRR